MKKILGFLFLFLGSILAASIILNVRLLGSLFGMIVKIFSGKFEAFDLGYLFGYLIGFSVVIIIIYQLFKTGMKWIKKPEHKD